MAKILVLDDHEEGLFAAQVVLESEGHEVLTGKSGKDIAGRVLQEKPNLLITDIFMPDEDGLGVINTIRSIDKTMPIIAVSGVKLADVDYLVSAKRLGANAILHKTFSKDELLKTVDGLLGREPDGADSQQAA